MRNPYEVLRIKEHDLLRVRKEVNALRIIAPLLMDDEERAHLQQRAENMPPQAERANAHGAASELPNPMEVLSKIGDDAEISSPQELADLLNRKRA